VARDWQCIYNINIILLLEPILADYPHYRMNKVISNTDPYKMHQLNKIRYVISHKATAYLRVESFSLRFKVQVSLLSVSYRELQSFCYRYALDPPVIRE
jgi:hypothetical protein